MKKNTEWIRPIGVLLTATLMLLAFFVIASSGTGTAPDQRSISAFILTPPPGQTVPPPVGTYQPPTITVGTPYVPPTERPLPPPPGTVALTPGVTASVPIASPTSLPAPSVTVAAGHEGVATALPNIAWGQENADGSVALWVGTYNDLPTPGITSGKTFVKWATTNAPESGLVNVLELEDLAFSPDGQSLAVLLLQHIEGEGFPPTWLYSVNLSTGVVQHMPDYSNYDIYSQFYSSRPDSIAGWVDSNRVAIQEGAFPSKVGIDAKDGTAYSSVPFEPDWASLKSSTLSPDRQTLFSMAGIAGRSFWLYNTDGSNAHQILGGEAKAAYYPTWSPNGKYIAFSAAGHIIGPSGSSQVDYTKSGVWILNLDQASQQLVSGEDAWNSTPAWSLDSAKLAFLRADGTVSPGNVWFNRPEGTDTNVFIAKVDSLVVSKLTNFTSVKNGSLQWTPGGNLIMSSTAAGTSGTRGVIAVSSANGSAVTLVGSAAGQQFEHPTLFISSGLPGMPKTGKTTPAP